jgi:hypothetical protein
MMAITTNNSTRVKPDEWPLLDLVIVFPPKNKQELRLKAPN